MYPCIILYSAVYIRPSSLSDWPTRARNESYQLTLTPNACTTNRRGLQTSIGGRQELGPQVQLRWPPLRQTALFSCRFFLLRAANPSLPLSLSLSSLSRPRSIIIQLHHQPSPFYS